MTQSVAAKRQLDEKKLKRRAFQLYKKHITGRGYVWPVGCQMPDDVQNAIIEGMREAYAEGLKVSAPDREGEFHD